MITPRTVKVFALTWFSFVFMFVSIEPYVLGKTPRELFFPALIGGFFGAVMIALGDMRRARREEGSAQTLEDRFDVEQQR